MTKKETKFDIWDKLSQIKNEILSLLGEDINKNEIELLFLLGEAQQENSSWTEEIE